MSPFLRTSTFTKTDAVQRNITDISSPTRAPLNTAAPTSSPSKGPKQALVPNTPSNAIHIATASLDGKVCVSSLIDSKEVTLRNFARPIQAVAVSPDFRNDRTYLSGGLAGNLILTVDGKAGVSADANTNSAAAAASGWLGSIGIGSNTGKDTVLHSGEGGIGTIKWSLTGKYVAWVNEEGIKVMRSHYKLDSVDADLAWKRIAHIDRPQSTKWDEMASVWKARADWVDDGQLEADEDAHGPGHGVKNGAGQVASFKRGRPEFSPVKKERVEKLVVGWGDAAWVIQVQKGGIGVGKDAKGKSAGTASIVHKCVAMSCALSPIILTIIDYVSMIALFLVYRFIPHRFFLSLHIVPMTTILVLYHQLNMIPLGAVANIVKLVSRRNFDLSISLRRM